MNKKIIGLSICILFALTSLIPISSALENNTLLIDNNEKLSSLNSGLHEYFNWKDYEGYDWTTPAKNQHSPQRCGSCWAFAAIGALESCIKISENNPDRDIDLSEQYILSCLPNAGSCNGGGAYNSFRYIMDTSELGNNYNGIIPESCMAYQADDEIPCDSKCEDWVDHLIQIYDYGSGSVNGRPQDIERIKIQIMEFGPVVSTMLFTDHLDDWLQYHRSPDEYYSYPGPVDRTNHQVVLVGWKDDESIGNGGYWIIKNSHGADEGYNGFFNLEYGSLKIDSANICWVSARKPDLKCNGVLSWTDVTLGETVYGNFTVENIGDSKSDLDWKITSFPDWGDWNIKPISVINLKPEDGTITVEVSISVSGEEKELFTGNIKIENRNNVSDYEVIDISLQLSKKKEYKIIPNIIQWLIERFPLLQPYFSNFL